MTKLIRTGIIAACCVLLLQACKKDDYYQDGGLANPVYNGTIYEYLTEKKYYFDTIKHIIDLAGMKDMFMNDTLTFFAPTDDAVKYVMMDINEIRYRNMEDSAHLDDIGPEVWRQFLSMYIMRGKRLAGSFPRVNPENISAFPGINYVMMNGKILNIGLIYNSYKGVEAVGARELHVTDVTFDLTNFRVCPAADISSSDIQPSNGVVHALHYSHVFGFRRWEFVNSALDYLRNK